MEHLSAIIPAPMDQWAPSGPFTVTNTVYIGPFTTKTVSAADYIIIGLATSSATTSHTVPPVSSATTLLPSSIVPSDVKGSISLPTTLVTDTHTHEAPSSTKWQPVSTAMEQSGTPTTVTIAPPKPTSTGKSQSDPTSLTTELSTVVQSDSTPLTTELSTLVQSGASSLTTEFSTVVVQASDTALTSSKPARLSIAKTATATISATSDAPQPKGGLKKLSVCALAETRLCFVRSYNAHVTDDIGRSRY